MPENRLHLLNKFSIEQAYWDLHWTGIFTLVAIHASPCQVESPAQVEGALFIQSNFHADPKRIVALVEAGRAIAHWARLAASIASDASVEL